MGTELVVYTDGGARGNPGPAAIGFLILNQKGDELSKFGKKIGNTTNNVAEYQAVIEALLWIKNNCSTKVLKVEFNLDSKLVVNQLNGLFKIKKGHLREKILTIRKLEQEIGGNIFYQYVPREKNTIADGLVNSSFDK